MQVIGIYTCSYIVVYFPLCDCPCCWAVLARTNALRAWHCVCPLLFLHNCTALLRGLTKQLWRQPKAVCSLWCSKTICHNIVHAIHNYLPTITSQPLFHRLSRNQSFACIAATNPMHVYVLTTHPPPPPLPLRGHYLGLPLLRGCHCSR